MVSHTTAGPAAANVNGGHSFATSADGAFVVFVSSANDLVPGQVDTNGAADVFLFERATGRTSLVSHIPGSATTTDDNGISGGATRPSISADGAFVVFQSGGMNMGFNDLNAHFQDVFLYTRATGVVSLVSRSAASPTTTGNLVSSEGAISADGSHVVFRSDATNLVTGQVEGLERDGGDVFLYARATGVVTLVSRVPASATTEANGFSHPGALSADAGYVTFVSSATNLVPGQTDTTGTFDLFLYTRATGAVSLITHAATSATTAATVTIPFQNLVSFLSADGALVVFVSDATNHVAGQVDPNGVSLDVFLYTRSTGSISLVSHVPSSAVTTGELQSEEPAFSTDGAFVAFSSSSTNMVSGQTETAGGSDVFLFQRSTGAVTLVSRTPGNATQAAGLSSSPTISADGGLVAFGSGSGGLVVGQSASGGGSHSFLYRRSTGAVSLVSHTPSSATTTADQSSTPASISANGAVVAFSSSATNLVAGQTGVGLPNVFVYQLLPTPARHPADFDGDADTDRSVFRNGAWFAEGQSTGFIGAAGDIPVPGDYDRDGDTDRAVYRDGTWFTDGAAMAFLGLAGDVPVPGDYDGDGDTDRAVYRPSVGGWFVEGQGTVFFGLSGDIPVPGDYDGDGDTDRAVFRPSVGGWYVDGQVTQFLGLNGDIPVPGDYNGDGDTERGIWRPAVGGWYVEGIATQFIGLNGDVPVPGDYDGDGDTERGIWRPGVGGWYLEGLPAAFLGLNGDIPLPLPQAVYRRFFV